MNVTSFMNPWRGLVCKEGHCQRGKAFWWGTGDLLFPPRSLMAADSPGWNTKEGSKVTSGPADLFCISSRTSKCNFHQHYWEGLKFCLSSTLIQVFSTQRAVAPEKFLRKYLLSLLLIFAQNTLIIISEFHRTLKGKGVPKIQSCLLLKGATKVSGSAKA